MKRNYFIAVEFWSDSKSIERFISAIVIADINEADIIDIAKEQILICYPDIDIDSLTIKVTAFNNIEG